MKLVAILILSGTLFFSSPARANGQDTARNIVMTTTSIVGLSVLVMVIYSAVKKEKRKPEEKPTEMTPSQGDVLKKNDEAHPDLLWPPKGAVQ